MDKIKIQYTCKYKKYTSPKIALEESLSKKAITPTL